MACACADNLEASSFKGSAVSASAGALASAGKAFDTGIAARLHRQEIHGFSLFIREGEALLGLVFFNGFVHHGFVDVVEAFALPRLRPGGDALLQFVLRLGTVERRTSNALLELQAMFLQPALRRFNGLVIAFLGQRINQREVGKGAFRSV